MSTAHLLHQLFRQDSELPWVKARTNGRSSVEEDMKVSTPTNASSLCSLRAFETFWDLSVCFMYRHIHPMPFTSLADSKDLIQG